MIVADVPELKPKSVFDPSRVSATIILYVSAPAAAPQLRVTFSVDVPSDADRAGNAEGDEPAKPVV